MYVHRQFSINHPSNISNCQFDQYYSSISTPSRIRNTLKTQHPAYDNEEEVAGDVMPHDVTVPVDKLDDKERSAVQEEYQEDELVNTHKCKSTQN